MSTQLSRQDQIKTTLFSQAGRQITALLNGDKEKANKFMAASLVVASDNSLRNCSPESIVQSLVGVAMLDLSIDKTIGHCYLVPYGSGVQLQIGYKGLIQLLYRAGWMVKAFPVFTCDEFEFENDGWDNRVKFKQNIDERDEGDRDWCYKNLRGVYVVARNAETKDEYSMFVNKQVIEKLRKVSPNQKNSAQPTGIWKDWFVEMSIAKAVKRLAKVLPIGDSRASLAISLDDKTDRGERVNYEKTAETGVVIDVESMEAKPEKPKTSVTLDSLIGGEEKARDTIIVQAQTIQSADTIPQFDDLPEPPPFIDDTPTDFNALPPKNESESVPIPKSVEQKKTESPKKA